MTFMEKFDFDKWLKAGLRKDEIDMLFNIISWVCIILVILYVIGLIVVIIIADMDKKSFCGMTSPLWLPIFIVFYLIYNTLKAFFKLFKWKKHQKEI